MQTSASGRAFIAAHEGVRLTAYRDPVGVYTIGVGHTAAAGPPVPKAGMVITREEADQILSRDLRDVEQSVSRAVTVPLAQHEFDALVSFTFNLGAGNLRSSTLLKRLNAGQRAAAADEFLKWNKAGGKVLTGLVRRRREERDMFLGHGTPPPSTRRDYAPEEEPSTGSGKAAPIGIGAAIVAAFAAFTKWLGWW